jgi:hypothetical protein
MATLTYTIYSVYLPPHTIVTLSYLQDILSQILAPLLLLRDFSAQCHLWDSVDEDERGWVIETLISRFNLVVLYTCEPHTSLTSDNLSCLDLTMCSPAISPDFTWRLLDDFCRSDIF